MRSYLFPVLSVPGTVPEISLVPGILQTNRFTCRAQTHCFFRGQKIPLKPESIHRESVRKKDKSSRVFSSGSLLPDPQIPTAGISAVRIALHAIHGRYSIIIFSHCIYVNFFHADIQDNNKKGPKIRSRILRPCFLTLVSDLTVSL